MSKTDGIGVWVWNEDPSIISMFQTANFNFVSNGIEYSSVSCDGRVVISTLFYGNTEIWNAIELWLDDAYKTIDIKTAPPAEFLTILQANATYQESTTPTPSQYLDTEGTKQFTTKTKEYVDSKTAYRITNVVIGTDTINITIEPASGGGEVVPEPENGVGTWKWNDTITFPSTTFYQDMVFNSEGNFSGDGTQFASITINVESQMIQYFVGAGAPPSVAYTVEGWGPFPAGWGDGAQTITIETDISGTKMLSYLQANATKQ